jgi:GNAT superfamily N-acetyltransferase
MIVAQTIGRPAATEHPVWSFDPWGPGVLRISDYFRPALKAHFARLSTEDLYLRFGQHCAGERLDAYIEGIEFSRALVLGVFDEELELVGVAHLDSHREVWELGLSVLESWRRRGVGAALLRRAMQEARRANADFLQVHCLSVNHALMRLVSKVGAEVVMHGSESDGTIALPPARALGGLMELVEEQIALANFGAKARALVMRRMVGRLWGAP